MGAGQFLTRVKCLSPCDRLSWVAQSIVKKHKGKISRIFGAISKHLREMTTASSYLPVRPSVLMEKRNSDPTNFRQIPCSELSRKPVDAFIYWLQPDKDDKFFQDLGTMMRLVFTMETGCCLSGTWLILQRRRAIFSVTHGLRAKGKF
jgi:hypothetical protein